MQTEVAQDSSSAYTMWNCTEVTIWHVFMWSLLSSKDSCPGMPAVHLILQVLCGVPLQKHLSLTGFLTEK